jgi:DNA-directed RNA polymerase beta' subunit
MHHSISIIRGSAPVSDTTNVDNETTLRTIAEHVARFCDDAPYLFVNDIQRKSRGWLPEFTISAATLVRTYVRSELCSAQVVAMRKKYSSITTDSTFVDAVLEAVAITIKQAMIDPGTAVGIIAAQSFSEPFTQSMLDSYKLSALGVSSRAKMSKCQEIMSAFSIDKLSNPIMTIQLVPEYSTRERAMEIAQHIEMLQFSQLIATRNIFYEKFAMPVHPQFMHERALIEQFIKDNPLLTPPSDLSNWCIRLEISKTALVQKNIGIQTIIAKMRNKYSDLYFVYTNERAKHVIIRIYIRTSGLEKFSIVGDADLLAQHRKTTKKSRAREERIIDVFNTIANTTIRGIDGIRRTKVDKLIRTLINDAGAIVNDTNTYGIYTNGTNLARVANVHGVMPQMLQTDAVQEVANILGIEAAHHRIMTEMRGLVGSCNVRHYMIYADEMTRTGTVTSIERSGLSMREMNNIALRAGQAAPVQVLTEAAINARKDTLSGLSGQITNGSVPRVGTLYNSVVIDPEVIKKYKKTAVQALSEL